MADDAVGGCCYALVGAFQQFFSTKSWGTDWTCWDKCCRCQCCWDAGEFDPNDRPDQVQQESGPKTDLDTQRRGEAGEEDLPAYKPNEQMSVPSSTAVPTTIPSGQASNTVQ